MPRNVSMRSPTSGYKILGALFQSFLCESFSSRNTHHAISKQEVHDKIVASALNENCLLTVHCGITINFHPFRNVQVPSPRTLLGAIDAFEKQEDLTFRYRLRSPVWWVNIHLVISLASGAFNTGE
jgi:hypothetical protein